MKFLRIAKNDDWQMYVVGDQKTDHAVYQNLEITSMGRLRYIHPEEQIQMSPILSELIGWNCIQRRNFGFIAAYKWGAEIIATVDDDNIPTKRWGKNAAITVGQEAPVRIYETEQLLFDPLAATSQAPNIWHRGFPVQLLKEKNKLKFGGQEKRKVLVQADLWNGDPDIDAICRIAKNPIVNFDSVHGIYAGNKPGPFNSQNTFLHRSVMRDYFMFPGIGRMDDIFASYYVQAKFPESVVYGPPSVFQDRNEHDLVKDLEAEMIGYKHALHLAEGLFDMSIVEIALKHDIRDDILEEFIGSTPFEAFEAYRNLLDEKKV